MPQMELMTLAMFRAVRRGFPMSARCSDGEIDLSAGPGIVLALDR
jgi:hypothetical protein